MGREAEEYDLDRYQTVYAKKPMPLLRHRRSSLCRSTFQNSSYIYYFTCWRWDVQARQTDLITDHDMHSEFYEVSKGLQ